MPTKVLIAANPLASGYTLGDIVSVLPDGADFGTMEVLPDFIRLTVSDATKAQADAYLKQWQKRFVYSIDVENQNGYRATVTVDPALISASGANAEVKQELKDYILSGGRQGLQVSLHQQTANSLTVNIAKPANLPAFRNEINDKFSEITNFTQFYFDAATVAAAVAAGGQFTRTRAQITAIIKDRLAE